VRVAVLTDAHANLPALEAALAEINRLACDVIVHTGDAIAIGPHPREVLDLLLATPQLECLVGNHEEYFLHGIPDPPPEWMTSGEAAHQRWTHAQLGSARREQVQAWAATLERRLEDTVVHFTHYGFEKGTGLYAPFAHTSTASALDRVFETVSADFVFFGHHHDAADARGRARYVNPGSVGCHTVSEARFCVAEFSRGTVEIERHVVGYDDRPLVRAFVEREVPEREFIDRTFFGGRLGLGMP
jgi:predicted phosphodiesterase